MKLDIFRKQWLDLVFEGRNKKYGAYALRAESPKTTTKALVIGAIIFSLVVSIPLISKFLSGKDDVKDNKKIDVEITMVDLTPPPEEDKVLPPPPPPEPPKSTIDEVRFPPPKVVEKEKVRDEEPPKVEELKDANPGSKTIKGSEDGDIVIDKPVGEGPKESKVTEDNSVYSNAGIEVKADFPGGIQKFYQYIQRNFRTDDMDGAVKIIVSFVVEKDGSLTDIQIARDISRGGKAGKEAKRVLEKSPKWKPGIQNGRPVRVRYSLPINIQVN